MSTPVYLNHAGCSKVSRQTLETILRHHEREAALGVYESDKRIVSEGQAFYTLAADLVGADPSDIVYTDSHTTGWEKALRRVKVGPGDVLLTSRSEWGGNLKALQALAQAHGADVQLMPVTSKGTVCVERLAKQLNTRVKLISVTWLGSNGGEIEPAAEIGRLAQSCDIPFFFGCLTGRRAIPCGCQRFGMRCADNAGAQVGTWTSRQRVHVREPLIL